MAEKPEIGKKEKLKKEAAVSSVEIKQKYRLNRNARLGTNKNGAVKKSTAPRLYNTAINKLILYRARCSSSHMQLWQQKYQDQRLQQRLPYRGSRNPVQE